MNTPIAFLWGPGLDRALDHFIRKEQERLGVEINGFVRAVKLLDQKNPPNTDVVKRCLWLCAVLNILRTIPDKIDDYVMEPVPKAFWDFLKRKVSSEALTTKPFNQ